MTDKAKIWINLAIDRVHTAMVIAALFGMLGLTVAYADIIRLIQ